MFTVYGKSDSGNCYKVRLALEQLALAREPFFVGGAYGIADISLFAYTHCAAGGGFDLAPCPAVRAWLERVRAQPRFVPLPA